MVVQRSTDHGRTFGRLVHVSTGFPASGADTGAILVEPTGRVDVLYQAYRVVDRRTYKLGPGYEYFTSSRDGGAHWSAPLRVGANGGTTAVRVWWIDGSLSIDAGGNLYATWDTQRGDTTSPGSRRPPITAADGRSLVRRR